MKILSNLEHKTSHSILHVYEDFPEIPRIGMFVLKNDGILYIYSSIDGTPTWYPLNIKSKSFVHTQNASSMTWTIEHNLDSQDLIYFIYDINNDRQNEMDATFTDNILSLTFLENIKGKCVVFAHDSSYASVDNAVTNGDTHDHSGGDGAPISWNNLIDRPTIPTTASQIGAIDVAHPSNSITGLADTEPSAISSSTSGTVGSSTLIARQDHGHDLSPHTHTGDTNGGQIAHSSLSGIGTNTHTQIDNHLSSTSNPHSVTASQIGALAASSDINLLDYKLQRPYLQDWAEVVNARGSISGSQTINLELGNVVTATIVGATQFIFTNPPTTGNGGSIELWLTNAGSYTITWPASIRWPSATVPTLTASGVDVVVLKTINAGTNWRGSSLTGYTS